MLAHSGIHSPIPSHAPANPQYVPCWRGVLAMLPWLHVVSTHIFPSYGGRSASSGCAFTLPVPSQTLSWQSPDVWSASGVPAATGVCVHWPATQLSVVQGL